MVAETPRATQQPCSMVQGLKMSSAVPAKIAGDNRARELTGMDLAVKLHYLRGVYFFRGTDLPSLGINSLKEAMFRCLELYYPAAGRIRRADGESGRGRPFVKCNDSGVRIVEGRSEKTVDEWLEMEDHAEIDDKVLVYDRVLGPDLGFTPLVFIQFTWFKCGGMSVGLSWAHVLGDAFCASSFLNMWAHIMAGHQPPKSLTAPSPGEAPTSLAGGPRKVSSLRRVEPVGDHWTTPSNRTIMRTHSFQITGDQLDRLLSSNGECSSCFHVLSAVLWKSISRIRGEEWPRVVNICSGSHQGEVGEIDRCLPGNRMAVGTVEADFPVSDADTSELASWMEEHTVNENHGIEEMVGRDDGQSDYILYGANLTIVNLEEADMYGLELKGQMPVYASYTIHGVGDEGLILILPWREDSKEKGGKGRIVTVTLPGKEIPELEKELELNPGFLSSRR